MEEEESGTVVMQIIAQGGEENLRLHDSLAVAAEGDELNEGGAPGESLLQQEQEQEGELGSPLQRSDAIGLYQEPEPLFSRDDGDIGVAHSNSSISTEMTEFADHSWREYDVGDLVLVSRDDAVRKAVILEKKAVESETNDSEEEKESDSNRTQFKYLVKYQDKEEGEEDWVDENAIAKQIEAEDDKAVINIGETPNEDDPKKKLLALSYMIGSTVALSIMSVFLKFLGSRGYPPFELVFFRSLFILVCDWISLLKVKESPFGPPDWKIRAMLVARGVCGFGGFSSLIYSVLHLPLPDAITLTYTSPLFTVFLAFLVLKEAISVLDLVGVFFNLGGVIIIAQPSFLFPHSNSTAIDLEGEGLAGESSASFSEEGIGERTIAIIVSIVGAFFVACAFVAVRSIGTRAHPLVLVSYFAMISTVLGLIVTLTTEHFIWPTGTIDYLLLFGIGATGFTGQVLVNSSLQLAKAAYLSNLTYLNIVWAFLWEMIVFQTKPSPLSFLGASLISMYAITATIKTSPAIREWFKAKFWKLKYFLSRRYSHLENDVDTKSASIN